MKVGGTEIIGENMRSGLWMFYGKKNKALFTFTLSQLREEPLREPFRKVTLSLMLSGGCRSWCWNHACKRPTCLETVRNDETKRHASGASCSFFRQKDNACAGLKSYHWIDWKGVISSHKGRRCLCQHYLRGRYLMENLQEICISAPLWSTIQV